MGFYVKFWGTRGSIPTPGWKTKRYGGNTSCVEVRVNDTLFILDAGTGLRELGVWLAAHHGEGALTAHMFFSHPHWDHIQGFPFFPPAYDPKNELIIYGTVEGDTRMFDLLSGQMQSDYFPVEFSDLGAEIVCDFIGERGRDIDGVGVSWFEQVHPGGSYGYRFGYGDYSVVFATDNEIDRSLRNEEESKRDLLAHRECDAGFLKFIEGADLLVADGQYTDGEYRTKVGWGHPRASTLVDAALDAGVKQLAITHHDPMQSDDAVDEKIRLCRERAERAQSDLVVFAARELVELRIDRPRP